MGEKLWQVARSHQVFCVTHLPQLAAFGDQHFTVGKKIVNDRTMTQTTDLAGDDRVRELALMLGTTSDAGMESARALVTEAGDFIKKSSPS